MVCHKTYDVIRVLEAFVVSCSGGVSVGVTSSFSRKIFLFPFLGVVLAFSRLSYVGEVTDFINST